MQEKQVTIGDQTFKLEEPFLVLATQNPIEQEGTYPLPEAQVDRFMLKLKIGYPTRAEERQILEPDGAHHRHAHDAAPVVDAAANSRRRAEVINDIYVDDKVKDYIVDLVCATRDPEHYKIAGEGFHPARRLAARDHLADARRQGLRLPAEAAATSRRRT